MKLEQAMLIQQLEDENWNLKVKLSLTRRAFRSARLELMHALVLNSKLRNKMNSVEKKRENDSTK